LRIAYWKAKIMKVPNKNFKTLLVIMVIASAAVLMNAYASKERAGNMSSSEESDNIRNKAKDSTQAGSHEKATFAAGCFWGVEAAFGQVKGVISTSVGYTGGHTRNPTYRQVCSGRTGHAEAVEVIYDPNEVSYEQLVEVFWNIHDPTTVNRQGPDVGSQYRSAIFYHNQRQLSAAEASKKKLEKSGKLKRPIVTKIVPASTFYRAEEYHQRYLEKCGRTSCRSTLK